MKPAFVSSWSPNHLLRNGANPQRSKKPEASKDHPIDATCRIRGKRSRRTDRIVGVRQMKLEALSFDIESKQRPHNKPQNTQRKPGIHTPHESKLKKKRKMSPLSDTSKPSVEA
jgi:hypothetical protein